MSSNHFEDHYLRRVQSEPQTSNNRDPATSVPTHLPQAPVETNSEDSPDNLNASQSVQNPPETAPPPQPLDRSSRWTRFINFFGVGCTATHERKTLVSVIWNLTWGLIQVTIITVVLILCGVHFKDPTHPQLSEWRSCDQPLGVWAALWIGRVLLASNLAYWEFRRDRLLHSIIDPENRIGNGTATNGQTTATAGCHDDDRADQTATSCMLSSLTYSSLTLVSSLTTLSWFLVAHILVYMSADSCRHTSPHVWWLVFGIMGILYLMILEVLVLGAVVLIIAPILFIFWTIILLCLGRHPIQDPEVATQDTDKLSQAEVDKIPLRVYIPPPPPPPTDEDQTKGKDPGKQHEYPPKSLTDTPSRTVWNYILRLLSYAKDKTTCAVPNAPDDTSWVGMWGKPVYPFVMLDSHQAACAICLMDFQEPKRKMNQACDEGNRKKNEKIEKVDIVNTEIESSSRTSAPQSSPALNITRGLHPEGRGDPQFLDAGEGAQPLRLLYCGHAFHKTCVDPWLTDMSGRCPLCKQAVKPRKPAKRS